MSSPGDSAAPAAPRTLENCLSCRLVCGGGLCLAAGFVYAGARKNVRGGMATMGTMTQILFALGLVSAGITVLARPKTARPQK